MKFALSLVTLCVVLVALLVFVNRNPATPQPGPQPRESKAALPSLPAHFIHASSQTQSNEPASRNHFRQFKDGDFPKLTPAQVEPYLLANHRNAESLLAALQTTGDKAFLREAMQKFPTDPKVAYSALFFGDLSPQEARQWADTFKQDAPGNSMADYASALNYMKSGQPDLALQDMTAAANGTWNDFAWQFMQSDEEAYRAAGYSETDAKFAAGSQLLLPDLSSLKQLGVQLNNLAQSYQQSGNTTAAQNAWQMDFQLGQQLSAVQAQPLITTLVGYAVENIALSSMDPAAPFGNTGQTVQDQLNQIADQRAYIKNAASQYENLINEMSDDDIYNYLQRRQASGEISALQWATAKYAPQ
jgi:hypothetical protein